VSVIVRSVLFNILFYVNLAIYLAAAMPTLLLPYPYLRGLARAWAKTNLWLLRVV
jgi:1-acyl-sn-glycerol-3-phosphate acyltransferase